MMMMMTKVQVRPVDSTGTLAPTMNQPHHVVNGANKHSSGLLKLMLGLCICQMIMMAAIVTVLGLFVSSHGTEIHSLKEKSAKFEVVVSSNTEQLTIIRHQNTSILEHSAQLSQILVDVSGLQADIKSQAEIIQQLKGNHADGNETTHDHNLRIAILESELATNIHMVSNHTDTIELHDKILQDYNATLRRLNDIEPELTATQELVSNHTDTIELHDKILQDHNATLQRLNDIEPELTATQELVSNHTDTIELHDKILQDHNATLQRLNDIEPELTATQELVSNHSNQIDHLESGFHEQNSSIQNINERVVQLEVSRDVDLDIIKELNGTLMLLGENVIADKSILLNHSSHLNKLGLEMAQVNEMVQLQYNSLEQLNENMTDYSTDFIAFEQRLNDLGDQSNDLDARLNDIGDQSDDLVARLNASETSMEDHDNRIGQLESGHLSETILNGEQGTKIDRLEKELNKTNSMLQDFAGDSTEQPVDGGWTGWTFWSSCSETCGNGQKTRARFCVNPRPANGGQDCVGSAEEQQTCNLGNCPVDGAWTTWGSWSGCSRTCGPGLSQRQRSCSNPIPADNGHGCTGNSIDIQLCETRTCTGVKSAFTVRMPQAGPVSGTIKFSSAAINTGNHYSTSTGKFTCVYPGLYVFHLHIMKEKGATAAYCDIRKNGRNYLITAATFVSGADVVKSYTTGSTTVVVELRQGDTIDLASCSTIGTFDSGWKNSFSGYLLQEI